MSKDRRRKEFKELTEDEKKILKVLDKQDGGPEELKIVLKALTEPRVPTNNFYNHTENGDKSRGILRLFHPGGGTAYALSYHPQKWAESLSGGEKPHIAAMGHYHKIEQLFYRNIHLFQVGTFEDQTPFMRRKKLSAHLGAWILYINKDEPIGLLGDTHLASKYHRADLLNDFYEIAHGEGVRKFYHAGDLVAGENMFRGQVYELDAHGLKGQADEVINKYPKIEGVETFYILGNHDLSFMRGMGGDISDIIDSQRPDMHCLGHEEADVKVTENNIDTLKSILVPYY